MRLLLIIPALALLAACSSGGGTFPLAGTSSASPSPSTAAPTTSATSAAPVATSAASSNSAVCDSVRAYLGDHVSPTLGRLAKDPSSASAAAALRTQATHMFALSAEASGAVSSAVERLASALVDESVAADQSDAAGEVSAANRANSGVARLAGVCGW